MTQHPSSPGDRAIYSASIVAAALGFAVNLFLFIYIRAAAPGVLPLQLLGMGAVPPAPEVLASFKAYGPQLVRMAAIDTVFTLCYLVFFVGLYAIARSQSAVLAALGLTSILLTAGFDATENLLTVFFAYNSHRELGYEVSDILVLYYLVTGLKWFSVAAAFAFFIAALPRTSRVEQAVVLLGLVFAAAAVLGLAWPGLGIIKGVLLWASMPVFVVLFWRYRGSQVLAAQQGRCS